MLVCCYFLQTNFLARKEAKSRQIYICTLYSSKFTGAVPNIHCKSESRIKATTCIGHAFSK